MINYFKKISSHIILSVFLVLPFFNNSYISYGTYAVKEVYICFAALLAAVLWLPGLFSSRLVRINPYAVVCAVFIILLLVSGAGNPAVNSVLYFERITIWLAVLFLPAVSLMPDFDKTVKALAVSNLVITAVSIIQAVIFLSGSDIALFGINDFATRLFGVFGNPDIYAAYLVAVIPLVFYLYDKTKNKSILLLAAVNVVLLLATGSAAGTGTLALLALVWAFRSLKGKMKYAAAAAAVILLAAAAGSIYTQKKDSALLRLFLWDSSVRMTAANPVFGTGAGNFRIFTPNFQSAALKAGNYPDYVSVHDEAYAHNDVLQYFSEAGIAGGGVFILFMIFPFAVYYRNKNRKREDAYIIFSMAGIAIFSLANFPFEMPLIALIYSVLAYKITSSAPVIVVQPRPYIKTLALGAAFCVAAPVITVMPDYLERGYLASYMGYAVTKELKADFAANSMKAWKDYQLSFYMGIMKSREGDYRSAIMNFKRALELFPGFAGAMYNLGNAYYNSGEMDNASIYYRKLIDLSPAYVPAYNNLALIEKKNGNYEEAIKLLTKAFKWNSGLIELNYNLADTYYLTGDMTKSREFTIKTLKIKADYAPAMILAGKLGIKP